MGKEEIIYGIGNGDSYRFEEIDEKGEAVTGGERTHWAPILKITSDDGARGVWVSIIPVDQDGKVIPDRAQHVEISRHGANRAIRAFRTHRDRVFGKDE